MKAILCKTLGPPEDLVLEDVDKPVAGENEAVVDVYAASLNFPDTLQIQGKYQFQPDMPFVPGGVLGTAEPAARYPPAAWRHVRSVNELW